MQIPQFGGSLKISMESFARKYGVDYKLIPDPASDEFRTHQALLQEVQEIEASVRPHLDEINKKNFDYFLSFYWDRDKQTDMVYAISLSDGIDTPMVTFHRNARSSASMPIPLSETMPAEPIINPLDAEPAAPAKKSYSLSSSESRTEFIARIIQTLKDGLLEPYKKYQKPLK